MADINKHNEEEEEQLIAQLKDDSQGPGRINASNGNMASTLLDVISAICKYNKYIL